MSVLDVSAHRILQGKEDVRQEGNMEKLRSLLQEKKKCQASIASY